MSENLFETNYDITKRNKFLQFYQKNKVIIFSFIIVVIIFIGSINFYFINKENKKIELSDQYMKAKFYMAEGNKVLATDTLKKIILSDESTYSTLAFFQILDQELVKDFSEITKFYNHLLENNKFEKEIKNLLIYKKALFDSNYVSESELLASTRNLINENSLWKHHTLLLLGDYFAAKKENIKAKEFYSKILIMKNISQSFIHLTNSKLVSLANE